MKINNAILAMLILLFACDKNNSDENPTEINFRQEMREFVIGISEFAKKEYPGFIVIPQNGIELITNNGESDGEIELPYLNAIDGNGQEDLFYGYNNDNEATPTEDNVYLREFLTLSKIEGKVIFVTDYCSSTVKVDNSYNQNNSIEFVSFAANKRELNEIPNYPTPIYSENSIDVLSISQVKNFLYLINPENFSSKSEFIQAVTSTNYDLLIMDLFFKDGSLFTATEINELHQKKNGGERLIIAYMSIGEAEDYRYYWQPSWNTSKPDWMEAENPDWEGNYKVKYWENDWQNIIYGSNDSYLGKILNAGFDGVYLDIIDAFEYFE